jgi:WD40 repeat-containing protein SMU1
MPQNCKVETACFSPNGQFLVTGTTDGYIEVWDPFSFKHSSDIPYQKDEIFMMHDKVITGLCVSSDSQFLASASEDKLIKVWMMAKGTCLRKFSDPNSVNTA